MSTEGTCDAQCIFVKNSACSSSGAHLRIVFALSILLVISNRAATPPVRSTHYTGAASGGFSFPHLPQYEPASVMTIEAWVYREDAGRCETIVSRGFTDSYWFGFCPKLRFYRGGGSFVDADDTVPARQWTHVAVNFNGTQARFYINGIPSGGYKTLSGSASTSTGNLYVGRDPHFLGYRFQGYLDEIRIWSVVRGQLLIQETMFQEVASALGLVARFPTGGRRESISGETLETEVTSSEEGFGILPRDMVVPEAAGAVTVDGYINLESEYAGAERVPIVYADGSGRADAIAYLVYRNEPEDMNLYVAVRGLHDAPEGWSRDQSRVSVFIDDNYSRDEFAQHGDWEVRGSIGDVAPKLLRGNGAGGWVDSGFPSTAREWAVAGNFCDGEFAPPCLEFRIPRFRLGAFVEGTNGFALGHLRAASLTDDHLFPLDAVHNRPATWGKLTYGDNTVRLPRVTFSGQVDDVTTGTGVAGHRVFLMNHDTGAALHSRVTDGLGDFDFTDVEVPSLARLRLVMDTCAGCRYDMPLVGAGGIAPVSVSTHELVFPGCDADVCDYPRVDFQVRTPPGRISIRSYNFDHGSPYLVLRDSPLLDRAASTIRIYGTNLHPDIEVFLFSCLELPPLSDCVEGRDYYRATVVGISPAGTLPTETWIDVLVPGIPPGKWNFDWRWVIHDLWEREGISAGGREWRTGPRFYIDIVNYPEIYGFQFMNQGDPSRFTDFDGVFGNNGWICLGAFDICACRVRDPLYLLYGFIYFPWISGSGGSCNGMAATSLLLYDRYYRTEDFNPSAFFPAGLDGDPPCDPDFMEFQCPPRPATYRDIACEPFRPLNLWAHIRSNHGVQASDEYIQACLAQMDGRGLLPLEGGAVSSISGDPRGVASRIRSNPHGFVISMVPAVGSGHVVSPYGWQEGVDTDGDGVVESDITRIFVYDNNFPTNSNRFIDIDRTRNRYTFQRRSETWSGDGIYTIPLNVWKRERTAPGLATALDLLGLLVFGESEALITTSGTNQWGFRNDGTFVDEIVGAKAIVPRGAETGNDYRTAAVYVPATNATPEIEILAKGPNYVFQTAYEGTVFQMQATAALPGKRDRVNLNFPEKRLESFHFTPDADASGFIPKIGMSLGDRARAVFEWHNLELMAGKSLGFAADPGNRSVRLNNDSGAARSFMLSVNFVDGASANYGTNVFGPVEIPAGASQVFALSDWPVNSKMTVRTDLDRDGVADEETIISPYAGGPQPDPPGLAVKMTANSAAIISWPVTEKEYVLEWTTTIPAKSWQEAAIQPKRNGERYEVMTPVGEGSRYMRLKERAQ